MNLKKLHESFIEKANRPMSFGKLPVEPKQQEVPVIAVERWREVDGKLLKTYHFRREGDRDTFLLGLLDYEKQVKHNALIVIQGDKVAVRLMTHDTDRISELDKEYAQYADIIYKDVVYSQDYHGT
jgi:pterin-4a-carbinolamine dehydratase